MPDINGVTQYLMQMNIPFLLNEPLAPRTTFKIGGKASVFCIPETVGQLQNAIETCISHEVRHYILGKGSNILFSDNGFDGVVIYVGAKISDVSVDGDEITAYAGATLSKICNTAAENSLSGLEFAYGIPGNVGGAVYMNAGAYGGEIKNVLQSVTLIDENNILRQMPVSELKLGYRTSIFEQKKWCIVKAVFKLVKADKNEIEKKMQELANQRVQKQPLDMPSAGSTFKRPQNGFAGALIEQCGLKGYTVGGAQISKKHCGFVVNIGNATCSDVLKLTDDVCKTVTAKTGITLEKEVRVVE